MEKWKNLDLSKTICVPPSGGKISTINIEVSDDETILSLEGKFQGYTSNEEIFDEEMREIERTRVVHDSSHSSLDENKLVDVDDDEQLEKEQINVTEEAEKELLEIMTKTKQREILKDSSKQEIIQMDKENNTKYRDGYILLLFIIVFVYLLFIYFICLFTLYLFYLFIYSLFISFVYLLFIYFICLFTVYLFYLFIYCLFYLLIYFYGFNNFTIIYFIRLFIVYLFFTIIYFICLFIVYSWRVARKGM